MNMALKTYKSPYQAGNSFAIYFNNTLMEK